MVFKRIYSIHMVMCQGPKGWVVSRVHNGWWVPETQSTTPSATDITIEIFIYALEALHLRSTIPLKYIEKNPK